MGPDGARNQERLCWRGPAEIYWSELVSMEDSNMFSPVSDKTWGLE
jgi:hypothetical protein